MKLLYPLLLLAISLLNLSLLPALSKKESTLKKMEQSVISFFQNKHVQETKNLMRNEEEIVKNTDGTTEEIIALRSQLGLARELANQQFDHLYHDLERPENELMEQGLSRLDSYWTAVGIMHNIFKQYTSSNGESSSDTEQRVIDRPVMGGRQLTYLMALLEKLDKKEYKTEGERFLINVEAHKHVQAIYTHVARTQQHS